MADLVSRTEQKTFMGVSGTTDDTLIDALLDSIEDMLERDCARSDRRFQAAENNRTEVRDGNGRALLMLDYPVEFVSSITLGFDVDDPDEELDPDYKEVVIWGEGKRSLERIDGGTFGSGCGSQPRYVTVEYKAQADLPEVAKLAVQRATAMLYHQIGSEDVIGHGESLGEFSHTLGTIQEDGIWKLAVSQLWEPVIA